MYNARCALCMRVSHWLAVPERTEPHLEQHHLGCSLLPPAFACAGTTRTWLQAIKSLNADGCARALSPNRPWALSQVDSPTCVGNAVAQTRNQRSMRQTCQAAFTTLQLRCAARFVLPGRASHVTKRCRKPCWPAILSAGLLSVHSSSYIARGILLCLGSRASVSEETSSWPVTLGFESTPSSGTLAQRCSPAVLQSELHDSAFGT